MTHVPVMMAEVLTVLPLVPGALVVDGTLGMGGHALEMAKRISPGGMIVGMTGVDPQARIGACHVGQYQHRPP